jgi:hypothetical protein
MFNDSFCGYLARFLAERFCGNQIGEISPVFSGFESQNALSRRLGCGQA